ncbi:TPA: hypothetical protein N0F65_006021, partial [Lagenidium giganteum]
AHTAKLTKQYFEDIDLQTLPHPPQSPHLNPIEHVLALMEVEVCKSAPTSTEQLKQVLVDAWNNLSVHTIQNLVRSMPKRMRGALRADGGRTQY